MVVAPQEIEVFPEAAHHWRQNIVNTAVQTMNESSPEMKQVNLIMAWLLWHCIFPTEDIEKRIRKRLKKKNLVTEAKKLAKLVEGTDDKKQCIKAVLSGLNLKPGAFPTLQYDIEAKKITTTPLAIF